MFLFDGEKFVLEKVPQNSCSRGEISLIQLQLKGGMKEMGLKTSTERLHLNGDNPCSDSSQLPSVGNLNSSQRKARSHKACTHFQEEAPRPNGEILSQKSLQHRNKKNNSNDQNHDPAMNSRESKFKAHSLEIKQEQLRTEKDDRVLKRAILEKRGACTPPNKRARVSIFERDLPQISSSSSDDSDSDPSNAGSSEDSSSDSD